MCDIAELVGQQVIVKGESVQFLVEGLLTKFHGIQTYCVEGTAPDHVVFSDGDVIITPGSHFPIITIS